MDSRKVDRHQASGEEKERIDKYLRGFARRVRSVRAVETQELQALSARPHIGADLCLSHSGEKQCVHRGSQSAAPRANLWKSLKAIQCSQAKISQGCNTDFFSLYAAGAL